MTCTIKHMCIDKFESKKIIYRKSCGKHRHIQACNVTSNKANIYNASCTTSDCEFKRLIRREDNPNKLTLIDIP